MPTSSSATRAEDCRFVFKGTVRKLRASAVPEVKASPRTAIVRVDEVIRAPEALATAAGHDVTVELGGRGKLSAGAQAVFYAQGWVFGDHLAVHAIDHEPVDPVRFAMTPAGTDPVANLASHDAKARFDTAAAVVTGQVMSVSVPGNGAAAAAAANGSSTMSEHDALWREASIAVHEVHKGRVSGKRVSVRFPASTDVLWHRAPKFQPGQQGFFLLQRADGAADGRAKLTAAPGSKAAYTALHPADFQPLDDSAPMRALVAAARATGKRSSRRRS
jgi:hypothetical protein